MSNHDNTSSAAAAAAAAAADKKRNKLGYHRTAIACGHCRRRKIRCIPPGDVNSNQCQNCVRLKKDCQYYPVDQTVPTSTKRSRDDTKSDGLNAESETSVSSSSPGLPVGSMEQYDSYRPHGGPYPLMSGHKRLMANENDYGYPQPFPNASWSQQGPLDDRDRYFSPSRNTGDAHNHSYWPPNEQISQATLNTPMYAMSANESNTGLTSPDLPYPAFGTPQQGYHYSPQIGHNDHLAHNSPLGSYGMYRAGTISDPSDAQSTMGLQTQGLVSPTYSATSMSSRYPTTPVLAPRWTEGMQVQPMYHHQATQQPWTTTDALLTQDKNPSSHILESQSTARHHYRNNPG